MVATASVGQAPFAVSPLSMTASVPSNTALATSVISARVGSGLLVMLSSICTQQCKVCQVQHGSQQASISVCNGSSSSYGLHNGIRAANDKPS
jgi:hypothetical protein